MACVEVLFRFSVLIYEPGLWTFGGGKATPTFPVAALNVLVVVGWIAAVGSGSASRQIRALGRVIAPAQLHHTPSLPSTIRFCSIH